MVQCCDSITIEADAVDFWAHTVAEAEGMEMNLPALSS